MKKIGIKIKVSGIVQGVGFRPFIHKQITDHCLCGWVRNTGTGSELKLEGPEDEVRRFVDELGTKKPSLALIERIETEIYEPLEGFTDFSIIMSKDGEERNTLISPDVCTCDDCLRELFDEHDRRYRYPFINCTNCGPRFTIIRDIPYDRAKTTMSSFPMCGACHDEYTDISDRRYHAQPDCCPDCGPRLIFTDREGREIPGDQIALTLQALTEGRIVAIKGLGGFHLACRADLPELALKLRIRKHRDEKPFALMCADVEEARKYCEVSEDEERILKSHQRPIVLLRKRLPADAGTGAEDHDPCSILSHLSENSRIGIMLPYTPVHFLLMHEQLKTLVMTSANLSDRPIIYRNEEALTELKGIADCFLMNDRDIHVRCDDSVMWVFEGRNYFARRSRGYVPYPLTLHDAGGRKLQILACGAEQKATFSLSKGVHVFSSQHIGDLKNIETYDNFELQIKHFEKLFEIRPEMLVCDLHPDYLSTGYAMERSEKEGLPLLQVQHHYAHMASCMADNGLEGPVIGIVWDGTGLGTDNKAWGGEFLAGDYSGFTRCGTIREIALPGGDKAVHEIWRIAAALLDDLGVPEEAAAMLKGVDQQQLDFAGKQIRSGINCPRTTSIGRLFDGVSALLGIRETVSYEGQGAILLEAEAEAGCDEAYPYRIEEHPEDDPSAGPKYIFDYRPMLKAMLSGLSKMHETAADQDPGTSVKIKRRIAAMFMNTLTDMAAEMAVKIRRDTGLQRVVLSGGSFQNMYILERLSSRLRAEGLQVYTHSRVACNDEGLSLGQLMIARKRMQ